jgi:hypothetical protein
MNYITLFETIKGYVQNDFPNGTFTDTAGTGTATLTSKEQIDTFIKQAEQRIYNSVQFPNFRKNQTGTLTADNKYLEAPVDFLASYSLAVIDDGSYEFLLNKDVNYIRAAYPSSTDTGVPKYYAQFDDNTFILGPTPDAAYTVELHYFYYPESIVTASTTWLGDNFDSALLYGSLLEAYTYMKGEPDVIANYNKRYEEAMILAKRLGDGMLRRDAYRSGQVRMTVN